MSRIVGTSSIPTVPTLRTEFAATAGSADLETEIHELNGQPALVFYDEGAPFAALLLAIADHRIHRVFFRADLERLHHLGLRNPRR